MMKSPPGIQTMDSRLTTGARHGWASPRKGAESSPRVSPAAGRARVTSVFRSDIAVSGFRELLRHEVERCSRRDQLFLLLAVLEIPDDALGVLHHPPAHVTLVDRLALLRIFLQMRDAGEAEVQF